MKKYNPSKALAARKRQIRRRRAAAVLIGVLIPLTAYSLTLTDYLNTAEVSPSSNQFEADGTNNFGQVQVTPNAELTIVKVVENDNGGLAGIGDFTVTTSAGPLAFDTGVTAGTTITFTSDTLYLAPGTFSLIEDDVAGYAEGTWSCSAGTVNNASFNAGEVALAFGEQATCTIINNDIAPTLTLTKTLVNDNGGNLTIADFDISVDGTEVVSGVANTVAANVDIDVSELDIDGYTQGTWSCVDANTLTTGLPTAGAATGTIVNLLPGSAVTCEVTNDDIAPTLSLTKNLVNDHGGNLAITDFDIAIAGTEVVSGVATTVGANAPITISELDIDGYDEGTWACSDANTLTTGLPTAGAATGVDVTLAPGSVVDCVITNDDIQPTLTLVKTLVNNNGGNNTVEDFDISIDGVEVINSAVTPVTANTPITISELDLNGYTEGTWSCVDANNLTTTLPTAGLATSTSLTLLPGSEVTCSITNDDLAPTLTLSKVLVNDNGGDLAIADFDISIDGVEVVDGAANIVASNTPITISELDLDGYTEGTWSCVDANSLTTGLPTAGLATGESITLVEGSDVTCTISNDDIAPTLALNKVLVNDNGGNRTILDFDISIDGVEVADGAVATVEANTPITIAELELDGYTPGTWSCVDANALTTGLPTAGVATGEIISLKQGSEVVCEITNDDIAPMLTLSKTVVNDNGGNLAVADFDISIDGVEVVDGVANAVQANTPITISELDLAPYAEGTWSCFDANALATGLPTTGLATGVSVTLLPGSDVTCEITNNDLGVDLSIVKAVDDNTPDIGQVIQFTMEVFNAGPDEATAVTVTDVVPSGFTYVAGSIVGGDASNDTDPTAGGLSWTINSIPAGAAPVVLTFEATVNAP